MKVSRLLGFLFILLCAHVATYAQTASSWNGDINHFAEKDLPRWQSGHWTHDFHEGRRGWWWVVGEDWYYYPSATYPYPDPLVPSGMRVGLTSDSSSHYLYHCQHPAGYYPYVSTCNGEWQRFVSVQIAWPQPPKPQPLKPMHTPIAPNPEKDISAKKPEPMKKAVESKAKKSSPVTAAKNKTKPVKKQEVLKAKVVPEKTDKPEEKAPPVPTENAKPQQPEPKAAPETNAEPDSESDEPEKLLPTLNNLQR